MGMNNYLTPLLYIIHCYALYILLLSTEYYYYVNS